MQPILNRRQIREYDRIAIAELGVAGTTLMENAGRGAADIIRRLMPMLPHLCRSQTDNQFHINIGCKF